jgi:hypothetical protein
LLSFVPLLVHRHPSKPRPGRGRCRRKEREKKKRRKKGVAQGRKAPYLNLTQKAVVGAFFIHLILSRNKVAMTARTARTSHRGPGRTQAARIKGPEGPEKRDDPDPE